MFLFARVFGMMSCVWAGLCHDVMLSGADNIFFLGHLRVSKFSIHVSLVDLSFGIPMFLAPFIWALVACGVCVGWPEMMNKAFRE